MTPRSLPPSGATTSPTPAAVAQARFWDRIARKYAADPIADLAGYETTLQRVRELLAPQHSVLEVGCGTGSTALRLAACTGRWLATDVSREMIAIAGEKLAAAQLPLPQLHFEVADAEAGVPGGGPYDVLLAFNLLHLVSDLDAALSSLLAAVKPGGLFISKTACLAEMNPLIPYLLLPLMRAFGKAPHALIFDAGQLRSAFERHGWLVEAVERHGSTRKDFRVVIVARKPH
ncbi:MAG: class I SAM-dependent methyltransferase [Burkholderiales bacterium]|nr:class I SAM-dependent methyltransferase [Burkholderiales bacterium]